MQLRLINLFITMNCGRYNYESAFARVWVRHLRFSLFIIPSKSIDGYNRLELTYEIDNNQVHPHCIATCEQQSMASVEQQKPSRCIAIVLVITITFLIASNHPMTPVSFHASPLSVPPPAFLLGGLTTHQPIPLWYHGRPFSISNTIR